MRSNFSLKLQVLDCKCPMVSTEHNVHTTYCTYQGAIIYQVPDNCGFFFPRR